METIREIFNNRLFRIPDYQRGYSWEHSHLEDFWQDLSNLQNNRVHYTGMVSVEEVSSEEYSKWNEDLWLIEGKNDTPYFIVDGQQRITTIIILIWAILNKIDEDGELSFETKQSIKDKYIVTENIKKGLKSYIFGYHKDNPSYQFLKAEIFEQYEIEEEELEITAYTNNLAYAKRFFEQKLKNFNKIDLEKLYSKITKQLKFDFKILEKELDIFIVFETMNNRGKPLSNLEKLKNRLIYLSTLLTKEDRKTKEELRDQINESWKTVYKYLGLSPEKRLDDDSFLQNHWIMFSRYDRREPEFYAIDIFERIFTTEKVIKGDLESDDILNYITSISEGARMWFVMNNPTHKHALKIWEDRKLLSWLNKLNRIGFKAFAPLIMAAMLIEKDTSVLIKLLKAIESYVFLLFNVSFRRSNTGTYHFNAKASELYKGGVKIQAIIDDITYWVYGDEEYKGYFDIDSFKTYLNEIFYKDEGYGYYNWKYLRYFLFEYEISLSKSLPVRPNWNEYNVIQPVLPFSPNKICWKRGFDQFSRRQKEQLSGSLGNFILTTKQIKIFDESCFDHMKENFYFEGPANQRQLMQYTEWTASSILNRGMKMLDFMEERWQINLSDEDNRKKLLFLNFEIE